MFGGRRRKTNRKKNRGGAGETGETGDQEETCIFCYSEMSDRENGIPVVLHRPVGTDRVIHYAHKNCCREWVTLTMCCFDGLSVRRGGPQCPLCFTRVEWPEDSGMTEIVREMIRSRGLNPDDADGVLRVAPLAPFGHVDWHLQREARQQEWQRQLAEGRQQLELRMQPIRERMEEAQRAADERRAIHERRDADERRAIHERRDADERRAADIDDSDGEDMSGDDDEDWHLQREARQQEWQRQLAEGRQQLELRMQPIRERMEEARRHQEEIRQEIRQRMEEARRHQEEIRQEIRQRMEEARRALEDGDDVALRIRRLLVAVQRGPERILGWVENMITRNLIYAMSIIELMDG